MYGNSIRVRICDSAFVAVNTNVLYEFVVMLNSITLSRDSFYMGTLLGMNE